MNGMEPGDVGELTGVQDPRVSPDGAQVAYVVWRIDRDANEYRSAIWIAGLEGDGAPRQFTVAAPSATRTPGGRRTARRSRSRRTATPATRRCSSCRSPAANPAS